MPHLLTLVDYSHPILHQVTERVSFPLSKEDAQLIEDMKYSVQSEQLIKAKAPFSSAAGMAANQWGYARQIFVFYPTAEAQLEVIINPRYEPLNRGDMPEVLGWEGCFSIPLSTGHIKRYYSIKVYYQNEAGIECTKVLSDWTARIFQHETDHLQGLLYDNPCHQQCIEKHTFTSNEALDAFYDIKKEERL